MNTVSGSKRSQTMARVRSKDTTPEMKVRRLVHGMGFRYRLHRTDLPGTPDLVFPSLRKIIFVHGCFWHQHKCKRGDRQPSTHTHYWSRKLQRNVERDRRQLDELRSCGWLPLVVWECETKKTRTEELQRRLHAFLTSREPCSP